MKMTKPKPTDKKEKCEKCGKRIKHVRDRSFIGAGSSRKSMTGVHEECGCEPPKPVYTGYKQSASKDEVKQMNEKEMDKEWEKHCKNCSCKGIGKWNDKGGTTENYHAFVSGYNQALSTLTQQHEKKVNKYKDALDKCVDIGMQKDKEIKELKRQVKQEVQSFNTVVSAYKKRVEDLEGEFSEAHQEIGSLKQQLSKSSGKQVKVPQSETIKIEEVENIIDKKIKQLTKRCDNYAFQNNNYSEFMRLRIVTAIDELNEFKQKLTITGKRKPFFKPKGKKEE